MTDLFCGQIPHAANPLCILFIVKAASQAFVSNEGKVSLFTTWGGCSDKNSEQ
ncbi:hypothetical protein DPMN_013292 [Dreissena polymorpha]|uniref:Uncharacterized protein n=1 Tax=Dreissena polymorpha TaxID=45954 RepID=A0A9D4N7I6_DREPO|nr:hypothetical protein DPMN_013292 [Dreissena polymorpha]